MYKSPLSASSVTLKNAEGKTVSADNAENVSVENGTYVTVTAQTTDGTTNFGDISLDGECANGQIKVDVDEEKYPNGQVTLNLCGLTLSNDKDSTVYISRVADECVITVKKDTVNTISDGTIYTNADGSAGAIYSLDDLKFKGKGSLTVNGNAGDAIVSKDDIKIWNGNLTVHAVDDGIRGKDSIRIGDPDDIGTDGASDTLNLTITSESGDGLKTTKETADSEKGYIKINGGTVHITAKQGDGIQAEQEIFLIGGDISIETYQGSDYTAAGSTSGRQNPWGGGMPGGMESGHALGLEFSCKGIKAGDTDASLDGNITVSGGKLTVNATDDAVHCGGTMPSQISASSFMRHRIIIVQWRLLWKNYRRSAAREAVCFIRWMQAVSTVISSTAADLIAAVISNHQLISMLEERSTMDGLTQVSSRNAMNDRLDRFVSGEEKLPAAMGVAFADLNGLKTVNDDMGHEAGDKLLVKAGSLLKLAFGDYEIYRAGGDEFVILCPEITEEKLEQQVKQLRSLMDSTPDVSFAIGSVYAAGEYDIRKVMHIADERMYKDKQDYYCRHPDKERRKHSSL